MISRGIVIKKSDAGEDNELVTFYTQELGKLTGVAKSVKKSTSKQASHLELFNLVDFLLIAGKGYPIVASAQSREVFPNLKSSLSKMGAGFFLLESFNRLIYDHEKDPALWEFLLGALRRIDREELAEEEVLECLGEIKKDFLTVMGYDQWWENNAMNYFLESLSQKKFVSLDFINSIH